MNVDLCNETNVTIEEQLIDNGFVHDHLKDLQRQFDSFWANLRAEIGDGVIALLRCDIYEKIRLPIPTGFKDKFSS
eukprot:IDg7035t1